MEQIRADKNKIQVNKLNRKEKEKRNAADFRHGSVIAIDSTLISRLASNVVNAQLRGISFSPAAPFSSSNASDRVLSKLAKEISKR